ncbi:MAG TPA: lipopolysaccharide biosynthesis protein [Bryobacteraceae bacterium]|nr:lipopolysaccharide biosynthesis protein [Bryobacteraceae bacterium]
MTTVASTRTGAEPRALPLRLNFAWSLLGNVVGAGAQWMLIVILARVGDAAMVGTYALALSLASPVFLLANLHLRTLQATDLAGEFTFRTYFGLRLLTSAAASLLLAAVGVFLNGSISGGVLMAIAAAKAFEAASEVCYGKLQREERMDRIGKSMSVRSAGSALAMLAALQFGWGLAAGAWMGAFIACGVFVYDGHGAWPADVSLSDVWPLSPELTRLARFAAPMGVALLLVSLHSNVPRYLLATYRTEREVGLISALGYLSIAGNMLVMAFGQAAGPALALSFLERNWYRFRRQAGQLLVLAAGLGILGILCAAAFGESLLGAVYGAEFAAERRSFVWLMAAGAASYLGAACGYLLSSARCFRPQIAVLAAGLAVTAVFGWYLIPRRGVSGAALAQAAGYSAQLLIGAGILGVSLVRQFGRT